MSRKENQILDMPCRVTRLRASQKFTIVNQMHVLNTYANDKKVYSKYPFVIKTSDGKLLAANCNPTEPWDRIIVWKGKQIKSDGTEEYTVPRTYSNLLFDQGRIYKDLTNGCYGVEDRKVYL